MATGSNAGVNRLEGVGMIEAPRGVLIHHYKVAATLLHKMEPAARPEDVAAVLDALGPIGVVVPDAEIVRRAVDVRAKYGVHFHDGMIVAVAEPGGCGRIWPEALNAGRKYFGIAVENPFR